MHYRPSKLIASAALAIATLAAAACSDSTVEPSAKSTTSLQPSEVRYLIATTSVSTVTLYPQYDNVYISAEGHRITIPAYSVCDPLTSGYGTTLWDAPCQPATSPIVFTITTNTDAKGASTVSVKPDVRFVPGKTVMAYLKDSVGARSPNSVIRYCSLLLGCIDEGKTDPAMKTYQDPTNGIVYRRLKHFSGYTVVFGINCDPSVDPSCDGSSYGSSVDASSNPETDTQSLASGYITTTGRSKQR